MKTSIRTQGAKKLIMVLGLLFMAAVCAFAQSSGDDFGLNTHVETILKFLNAPWVKGIACIALIIECIGLVTMGRQEPGMWKKFVPWIAGTVLFMAAGTITSKFLTLDANMGKTLMTDTN
jgi:type IV secretory pathway VirB2 component (pilin)